MKAMILAAGRGSRLKPLTDTVPKPLLSAGSENLMEHNLKILRNIGVRGVVINISYHAKQIMDYLGDGKRYKVDIHYSYEKDQPLGTGGGIFQALPLLGDQPFIIISADVWSEFSFGETFFESSNDAHLVFVKNPYYHTGGDYALTPEDKVSFEGKKLTYAGIAKLHPRLFANCEPGIFSLSPLLNKAIEHGKVTGELYEGCWFNVGTAKELEHLRKTVC